MRLSTPFWDLAQPESSPTSSERQFQKFYGNLQSGGITYYINIGEVVQRCKGAWRRQDSTSIVYRNLNLRRKKEQHVLYFRCCCHADTVQEQHLFQFPDSMAHTTSSDACHKHKFVSTEDMPVSVPRSKRLAKARGRTETLNPVIILSQLNSTLSRLADIMDKSLDASHTQAGVAIHIQDAAASGSSHPSSIPSQPPNPSSTSDSKVLDKALLLPSSFLTLRMMSSTSHEISLLSVTNQEFNSTFSFKS